MNLVLSLLVVAAQAAPATPPPIRPGTERRVEEINIGRTLDSVYAVISGPAGQKRDWAKMRSLFTEDARLYSIGSKGLRGGNLAHAWSSYEGIGDGGKLKLRGINSFQLVRQADGSWKVFTILWQPESAGNPLPADMNEGSAK